MSCEVDGAVWPLDSDMSLRLFHYSRLGTPEEVANRIRACDSFFHHPSEIASTAMYDWDLHTVDSYAKGVERTAVLPSVLVPFRGSHPEAAVRHILK